MLEHLPLGDALTWWTAFAGFDPRLVHGRGANPDPDANPDPNPDAGPDEDETATDLEERLENIIGPQPKAEYHALHHHP